MSRAIAMVLILSAAGACKSAEKPAEKPAEGSAAPAAPAATLPTAMPTRPILARRIAPAATAGKLGPIDLAAATLDLAALFPGDVLCFEAATESEGSMPASPDTIYVTRKGMKDGMNGELVLAAGLDGKRVARLEIFARGIAAPTGVEVGMTMAEVGKAVPAATCDWGGGLRGMLCAAPGDGFTYQFDTSDWSAGAGGAAIAKGPQDTPLQWLIYDFGDGKGPTVGTTPPVCKA